MQNNRILICLVLLFNNIIAKWISQNVTLIRIKKSYINIIFFVLNFDLGENYYQNCTRIGEIIVFIN